MRCGLTNSVLLKYQVLLLNVSTSTCTDTVIHGVFLASFNSGHDTLRYYYNKFKMAILILTSVLSAALGVGYMPSLWKQKTNQEYPSQRRAINSLVI